MNPVWIWRRAGKNPAKLGKVADEPGEVNSKREKVAKDQDKSPPRRMKSVLSREKSSRSQEKSPPNQKSRKSRPPSRGKTAISLKKSFLSLEKSPKRAGKKRHRGRESLEETPASRRCFENRMFELN